jgi:hypothetical protein
MDERATQLVLQGRITARADVEVYEVQGFSGRDYFVMVAEGETIGCTCPASRFEHEHCYVKDGVKSYLQMHAVADFLEDGVEYGF